VANRSRTPRPAALRAAANGIKRARALLPAQGRLDVGHPIAVIDIGSNSVRLVIYEGLTRAPTPIFNEKVLAGLGREVQSTGLLARDAVEKALDALRRFRALCDRAGVKRLWCVATAACRDAQNGPEFIAAAESICRKKIEVLSGSREARLSALGVVSGIYRPDGIVGDLGGGSLELVDVHGHQIRNGITLPLGSLALQDLSEKSVKKAEKIVRRTLGSARLLKRADGRRFYAVGGTWRALARLHMFQTGYPLHVMHGYVIPAREAIEFSRLAHRVNPEMLSRIEMVNEARRPLLAYAALVLEHVVRIMRPREIVISALGVREGLLYSELPARERVQDGLIAAAQDLNLLRSRSPLHCQELIAWTDRFMSSSGLDETAEEKRLRPPRKSDYATRHVCWPTSVGARIRITAASNRSTSSPTRPSCRSIIRAARSWRCRCSSATSGWSMTTCRRMCSSSRARACLIARACSAPRCASPIWRRRRCRACCRSRRWWSSVAS